MATPTTTQDLERLAKMYGYVPTTVLDAWKADPHTDAEKDDAQIAIMRGILAHATDAVFLHMKAIRPMECPENRVTGRHVYAPLDDMCLHCRVNLPRRAVRK